MKNQNISKKILKWYDNNKRQLPWRKPVSKKQREYFTLVSEFMLQQTQVKTVIPYFKNFLNKIPNLKKLSMVSNIKLMKCGGISAAREIASTALSKGIDLMWGCNDESIISVSAALNVAMSYPNTKYLDLDGSFDLEKDVVVGGFEIKDGLMIPVSTAGLGVALI